MMVLRNSQLWIFKEKVTKRRCSYYENAVKNI